MSPPGRCTVFRNVSQKRPKCHHSLPSSRSSRCGDEDANIRMDKPRIPFSGESHHKRDYWPSEARSRQSTQLSSPQKLPRCPVHYQKTPRIRKCVLAGFKVKRETERGTERRRNIPQGFHPGDRPGGNFFLVAHDGLRREGSLLYQLSMISLTWVG